MMVDKNSLLPNSMAIPSTASFVIKVRSKAEIIKAIDFAEKAKLPLLLIGSGTNIIPNSHINAVVVILNLNGIERYKNRLKVQAGEKWDDVVKFAVKNNLSGIETLSWIPGKAGAAPVQNIGAYGTEISEYIEKVEVYDRKKKKFVFLDKKNCQFAYRNSLFKNKKNKFIIVSITLSLSKKTPKIPKYKDIENYFKEKNKNFPNLKEIRKAIIKIRKNKLPDPKVVPNCGSFFKNPIIGKREVIKIKEKLPDSSFFPIGNKFKIPAGFLIEKAGFKGKEIGKIRVYKNNALVLTNPKRVPFSDLMKAEKQIQNTVYKKFGIMLEPEVNIIE